MQQLWSNKLRSFLSLFGIAIGIWCIVAVLAAVDSLEFSLRKGFERLGNDVLYVQKMPWNEDPQDNYWKYMRRPNSSISDLKAIEASSMATSKACLSVFVGGKSVKTERSYVENVFFIGITFNYTQVYTLNIQNGRFFSFPEYNASAPCVVLGAVVAEGLFNNINPVGRYIWVDGRKMNVVGVIKKSGKDLFNPVNFDNAALIPYTTTKSFLNIANSRRGTILAVKAKKGVNLAELKDDIRGVLRAHRRTKPKEDDSFSMNSLSIIAGALDNIFKILNSVGFIIGFFSLIVGMFGVANIMFVSVKERTSIIGIKKALGAKRIFILTEFLAEAVVLTFLGGCLGLLMVWLVSFVLTAVSGFEIFLSTKNLLLGLGFSTITGIIAGILPAWRAANLDPVEAIRQ